MTFEMPKLSLYEVNKLIDVALSDANFWAGQARKNREEGNSKEEKGCDDIVAEESTRYYAWVNWSRQEFPDRPCNFMLDDERERYGCSLPFDQVKGDRLEHDGLRWNIMRNGCIVTKRK